MMALMNCDMPHSNPTATRSTGFTSLIAFTSDCSVSDEYQTGTKAGIRRRGDCINGIQRKAIPALFKRT
jgi:hypothetical protein